MNLDHIAEPLRSLAVPLADLVLDPANARKHDDANLEAIRGSLRAFGQRTPLVVNRRTGIIIKGNGTTTAARSLGWTHLAAVYVDDDQATQTAYAVADNRTSDMSSFDDEVLGKLLADLQSPDGDVQKMLDDLKAAMPDDHIDGVDAPDLPDGDKQPFQQMTFTLHDDQAEQVKTAMDAAKKAGPFVDTGNENSNGNALARIAEAYLGQC